MKAVRTISSVAVQLRSAIVVSILSTALGHAAHACQCDSTVQTPCNSLSHSGVVFIGTVKSIENRPWSEFWSFSKFYSGMSLRDRLAIFRDEVIVNFSVEETYKGSPARELSIRVGKFGGSCGFEYKPGELYFKKGEQYLVYAGFYGGPFLDKSNADGHLRTNHCSGTTLASNATEKIKAYRALKGLQRPLVLGRYDFQPEFNKKAPARAQRVTLVPRTGTRLNAIVQEDGSFLLTSVPSATYTLASTTAKNYRLGFGNPETINVEADSCTEIELVAIPDGTLSGTVISSNGQPLSGATVRLWNTNDVSGLELGGAANKPMHAENLAKVRFLLGGMSLGFMYGPPIRSEVFGRGRMQTPLCGSTPEFHVPIAPRSLHSDSRSIGVGFNFAFQRTLNNSSS